VFIGERHALYRTILQRVEKVALACAANRTHGRDGTRWGLAARLDMRVSGFSLTLCSISHLRLCTPAVSKPSIFTFPKTPHPMLPLGFHKNRLIARQIGQVGLQSCVQLLQEKATRFVRVALLLVCDELPAYERDGVGVGVTPSCCNIPAWSTVPQCSTILPSLKRLM
jgi:hypothetical protein